MDCFGLIFCNPQGKRARIGLVAITRATMQLNVGKARRYLKLYELTIAKREAPWFYNP